MSAGDLLTAPADSIPRRGERLTALDVARRFGTYPSPRIIAAALAVALAARVAVGHWSWRDLIPPLLLIVSEPLTEWTIHVYLLHAPPVRIRGRRVELPTATRAARAAANAKAMMRGEAYVRNLRATSSAVRRSPRRGIASASAVSGSAALMCP